MEAFTEQRQNQVYEGGWQWQQAIRLRRPAYIQTENPQFFINSLNLTTHRNKKQSVTKTLRHRVEQILTRMEVKDEKHTSNIKKTHNSLTKKKKEKERSSYDGDSKKLRRIFSKHDIKPNSTLRMIHFKDKTPKHTVIGVTCHCSE